MGMLFFPQQFFQFVINPHIPLTSGFFVAAQGEPPGLEINILCNFFLIIPCFQHDTKWYISTIWGISTPEAPTRQKNTAVQLPSSARILLTNISEMKKALFQEKRSKKTPNKPF